jgi:capsular exopolysaccharide synthesis family protein
MTLSQHGRQGRYAKIGGERQLHLRDILKVLGSHWRVVAFLTVLVVFAAYTQARRTVPRYQSELSVQVNSKKQVFARMDDIDVDELALKTDPVLSEALVLSTQRLALTVVDNLGLRLRFQDPETWRDQVVADVQVDTLARPDSFVLRLKGPAGYEVRTADQRLVASGTYDAPVLGPGFRFRVRPYEGEPYDAHFAIVPRVAAAALVSGGLSYDVQGATNSINVRYQGTDPTLVPEILNAAAIALREYGANRTKELADQRLTYIRGQVEQAAERYRQSLGEVQRYKERQQLTDLTAEEVATINSIQDFEHQRQRRMADVASLRGVLAADTSVSIEAVNRLAAIPGLSDNSALAFQIQNVLKLYDDRRTLTAGALGLRQGNPQVGAIDDRIAHGAAALREAANATLGAMQADVTAIDRQIADLRARLQTFPGKESAFAQLTLESDLLNDTYRYLLSQYQAASISSATIHPYIEIMDAATTAGRVGVGVRQKLMIGLLVGLFLGILAAFLLEYLDQTIKTAGDVERVLDVPVLGLIPFGPHPGSARAGNGARRRSAIPLVSLASPEDPTAEAYRALRTNVTFVNAEERALQLLSVTSPGPGEGKSTTAANLAITLAQQGTHVLLVDADLRRPVVHRAFNLVQEPGLTDILVGSTTLREAARPNVVTNLDVLPAGALPPNPSELLGSAAMHRLLEQLRVEYDMVVFDSPPALAVTDSTVLGASTDGVIVVVRSGETEEAAAQQTMEQLRRVHARVAGAVLNGVAKQGDRYYYYERGGAARKAGPLAALRSRLANFL